MKEIKTYKVCGYLDNEIYEYAICTTEELALKAVERLVSEEIVEEDELFIEEDEIILNATYEVEYYDLEHGHNNIIATGSVRRFDDLGRIVIPKSVRVNAFETGEVDCKPMEIFYKEDGTIILKPYEFKDK